LELKQLWTFSVPEELDAISGLADERAIMSQLLKSCIPFKSTVRKVLLTKVANEWKPLTVFRSAVVRVM